MKSLIIRRLVRSGSGIADDQLSFKNGVNVLVGRPNTGKTRWLQMLDYAFGSDSPPKEAFGEDLAEKFNRIEVTAEIDGEPLLIERRWHEPGNRTKVFVDGQPIGEREFSTLLLTRLDIPVLHYPQGDPHGPRTWPQLSWRSLLRHIYRRQHFWADLADAQPTSEQHAALLQFVGVAEHLFSDEYAKLIAQEKQMWELQASKQQFLQMLHEVSRELLDEQDRDVALTSESLLSAIQRVRDEIASTQQKRAAVIASLVNAVSDRDDESSSAVFDALAERLNKLRHKQESIGKAQIDLLTRAKQLEKYYSTLEAEVTRLQRATAAGETLADLKVTHCPACDQPIATTDGDKAECYVCNRPKPSTADGLKRLAFEADHIVAEQEETRELLSTIQKDIASHITMQRDIGGEIRKIEALLQPTQRAAASILPPDIAILDTRTGQLQQRLEQLQRIRETFARRDKITEQIARIEESIASLSEKVRDKIHVADLEQGSDWLSDGMNDYLNEIDRRQPHSWPHAAVSVRLRERSFDILVGRARWSATLGGTLTLYFLIAYHYALLTLYSRSGCHYPGLVILDFPPVLEDGSSVRDKENFVVEPFVGLMAKPQFANTQLIAAGSAFEGLEGANRVELTRVWTGGGIGQRR